MEGRPVPRWQLHDDELRYLDRLALVVLVYLVVVDSVGLWLAFTIGPPGVPRPVLAAALFGLSGSAVAALTSCLDRYAVGFEREDGSSFPAEAKGNPKFSRRMARWFLVRPILGLIVAPVFLQGIALMITEPAPAWRSPAQLSFIAFMAGLLAKSVLDLIKGLFKNVFRT
jgi:hypothetical protein